MPNTASESSPASGASNPRRSSRRELGVRSLWILTDGVAWAFAVIIALFARFGLDPAILVDRNTLLVAGLAAVVHGLIGVLSGPYMVRHMRGSFDEVTAVTKTAFLTALVLIAVSWMGEGPFLPRSVALFAPAVAIVNMLAIRFLIRSYRSHRMASNPDGERVIVLGAGLAGRRLVHNMLHDDRSQLTPVALIDDDRSKKRLRIEGVRVVGTRKDLTAVAERTGAKYVAVAIPRADGDLLREIREQAQEAGLQVKVLPPIEEWLRQGDLRSTDLRDLNLEDLLGRRAVQLDQQAISEHITGKVVLVTGAGGSIGSELCRQIAHFAPARLILLDRDESALHSTQLTLTGRALLHGEDLVLADIRSADTMREHFAQHRPDIVFHAAALKHLSLLERYPMEAWKTNVLGTLNVLQAATEAGVGTFVNVSTDKAASPTCVLGYSKRVAERLTAHYAKTQPGRYVSVRFGNVLGSRGSVIPAFTEQIRRGGPVTVTHPDVQRYFMLIPEACQLVLQAGAIGRDGQVMVLDMGTPVKIVDVAQELIAMSGKDIDIQFTGLRPGEKLSEDLFTEGESHIDTGHPLMTAVDVPPLMPDGLQSDGPQSVAAAMSVLAKPVPGEVARLEASTPDQGFGPAGPA